MCVCANIAKKYIEQLKCRRRQQQLRRQTRWIQIKVKYTFEIFEKKSQNIKTDRLCGIPQKWILPRIFRNVGPFTSEHIDFFTQVINFLGAK